MLARWVKQGRACAYCPRPADTVDHVVPLVQGGTNYEGNLVPCCRPCNSAKAGMLLVEWRNGRRPQQRTAPLKSRRKAPVKPIMSIRADQHILNICPECGSLCVHTYCDSTCGTRYTSRRNYRRKVGIPLDAPLIKRSGPRGPRASAA